MRTNSRNILRDPTTPEMGDWEYTSDHYGEDEPRFRDGAPFYGRTTDLQRQHFRRVIMQAQTDNRLAGTKWEAAAEESAALERTSYAYAMAWYDVLKHQLTAAQGEFFMRAAWEFSEEVAWATFRFEADEASGKYGYTAAWDHYVRNQPGMWTILHSFKVVPILEA